MPAPQATKPHPPILVAQIEDFVLLLATFNKTDEPGACGYVQIGSQPSDTSIHATPLDDRTPSFALVEAMRSMLEKEAEGSEYDLLVQLVSEQMQKHEEQVNREYERCLVQKLWRKVSQGTAADLIVVGDSSETLDEQQKVIQAEYLPTTVAPDGRRIRLALVKATDKTTQIFQLQAVTRGKLGLPLGHFNAKDASFEPTAATLALGSSKEALVQTMLTHCLPAAKAEDRHYLPGNEESLLLGINQETDYLHNTYSKSYIPILKQCLKNPDIYASPITNSVTLDNATYYRSKQNEPGVALLNAFGAVQQLVEMHGQTTPHYEYFLDKLHRMFGDKTAISREGVVTNTRSGKTTDHVNVKMDFSRDGSTYQVKLFARPASMDNVELTLVRQSLFDVTLPLPDGQEIAALLDILDTIE